MGGQLMNSLTTYGWMTAANGIENLRRPENRRCASWNWPIGDQTYRVEEEIE